MAFLIQGFTEKEYRAKMVDEYKRGNTQNYNNMRDRLWDAMDRKGNMKKRAMSVPKKKKKPLSSKKKSSKLYSKNEKISYFRRRIKKLGGRC